MHKLSLGRRTWWIMVTLTSFAVAILVGCNSVDKKTTEPEEVKLIGSSVTATDCKSLEYVKSPDTAHDAFNCLEFAYDGDSVLSLRHVNALFNCCPDSFAITVSVVGETITITEVEVLEDLGCDCVCLYDLDYQVFGVLPGHYTIKVIEPYRQSSEAGGELQFSVDLIATPVGSFCAGPTSGSWSGEDNPEGTVTKFGECNANPNQTGIEPAVEPECVSYTYVDGALNIEHRNATFNCCADSSSVTIGIIDQTLIIQESEHFVNEWPCRCLCLVDFNYKISDLVAGQYTVLLLGAGDLPYAAKIIFPIDLVAEPSGEYCRGE